MKRNMIKLAAGAAAVLLMTTSAQAGYTMKKKVGDVDTKLTVFGFSQINAQSGTGKRDDDGSIKSTDQEVAFGADRIRLGWKYQAGKVRGKVFLDFNQATNDMEDVGMRRVIKDAFISYVASPALVVKAGVIKTPVGMGFTIPGWNLDVIKRGFDKQLAFERGNGLMISGRDMFLGNNAKVNGFEMGHERPMKGFGYDIMIANQTTRGGSIKKVTESEAKANAYMARVHFDYTEALHLELSYGTNPKAGGKVKSETYEAMNFGLDSHFFDGMNAKVEYYKVSGIKGKKQDMQTLALTYTAYVTDDLEFALKSINGKEDGDDLVEKHSIGNHFIGFNWYPNQVTTKKNRGSKRKNNQHVVKLNYVATTGDTSSPKKAKNWVGNGKAYKSDVILAMYQFKF
jgi:hypothetical protein